MLVVRNYRVQYGARQTVLKEMADSVGNSSSKNGVKIVCDYRSHCLIVVSKIYDCVCESPLSSM